MEQKRSLREWAKTTKVWEPDSWKVFLENDLLPFYRQTRTLYELYRFLEDEICTKKSLSEIQDEALRNKIRVTIYGGAQNPSTSFAKFMYDNFGICAENASSFEESVRIYEKYGDGIKPTIKNNSWMASIPIEKLNQTLNQLIKYISNKLHIEERYQSEALKNPRELLPQAGEQPESLISALNEFKKQALNLSIGINPFTTFAFYVRAIPLSYLMRFLECEIEQAIKLIEFLGLEAYSMWGLQQINKPISRTDDPDKIWLYGRYTYSLCDLISYELQSCLVKIDQNIERRYNDLRQEAVEQINAISQRREDYKEVFALFEEILKRDERQQLTFYFYFEDGDIKTEYQNISRKIRLADFLIKIAPFVCAGIIDIGNIFSYGIALSFHSSLKNFFNVLTRNEGKT